MALLPTVLLVWTALCAAALLALVGLRAAYFGALALPWPLEDWTAWSMRQQVVLVNRQFGLLAVEAPLLLALAGTAVFRRRLFAARGRLRPWLLALGATLCLYHNYLFDADPFAARVCWALLALFALWLALRARANASWLPAAAVAAGGVLLSGSLLVAPSRACALAVAVFAADLAALGWLGRRLVARDALALALFAMPLFTFAVPVLFVALLPGPLRAQATLMESRGYAYSFCEIPERHRLFVSVPVCSGSRQVGSCDEAYVAEYDTRDFSKKAEHRFFDDRFFGRLRELLCVGDVVQVAVVNVRLGDRQASASILEFDADDPTRFRRTIYDDALLDRHGLDLPGHRTAYDREHRAAFYVSEWTNKIFRLDLATRELVEDAGRALPEKAFRREQNFGLVTGSEAIDYGRDSLFLNQWTDGSAIYELGLEELELRSTLDTHDAGSIGLTVDEAHDRLIAAGLWGINVFDLGSGGVVLRRRLGLGLRTAQIDTRHDLVYVAATFGGYVWVLDRESLRSLGRIPTGIGGRQPYISRDSRHLFVSDQRRTWRYDTDDLARHFAGPAGERL